MDVAVHPDGSWSYEQVGVLDIPGRTEPFEHIDRNTLTLVAPPTPNPLARSAVTEGDLGIGNLKQESGARP
jgi:hypothetical protein